MTDITEFPIPTEVLDPANYPEFVGAPGAAGADGQEIELQKTATHVQWRYVDGTWSDLIALTDITGPAGAAGDDGAAGVGVPTGGTSSQLLAKNSNTNYDTHWIDAPIAQNAIEGDGVAKITSGNEPTTPETGDLWIDPAGSPTAQYLKPVDVVDALNSTSAVLPLSAKQGKALNDGKLDKSGGTIGAYTETGETLTPVNGALTIPLDGKTYAVTITAAITSITTTAPTAPLVGSAVVYFTQNGTGGYAVSIPAAWYWADGVITAVATAANAKTRLTLVTSPAGNVHADAEVRSVPA